jgi:hypothetical protein
MNTTKKGKFTTASDNFMSKNLKEVLTISDGRYSKPKTGGEKT